MSNERVPAAGRTRTPFVVSRAVRAPHIVHVFVALLLAAALLSPRAVSAQASKTLIGRLTSLVTDPMDEREPSVTAHFLVQDDGTSVRVDLGGLTASVFDDERRYQGRRLRLQGVDARVPAAAGPGLEAALRVNRLELLDGTTASLASIAVPVTQNIAVILCRFSDRSTVPSSVADIERSVGAVFPGAEAYWNEVSNGTIRLAGTRVFGWYTLARSFDYYYGTDWATRFSNEFARDNALRDECTAVADADVFFPGFAGIAMHFNRGIGSSYAYLAPINMTRDGVTRGYRTSYLMDWSTREAGTWAHEFGHTFGLRHSGANGLAYVSPYDVMSNSRPRTLADGWKHGTHTNAYHKDDLGFVPLARKWVPGSPSGTTFSLERSALPSSSGFLMAQIPSARPGIFYVLEARRRAGLFEDAIPREGVVIHQVNPTVAAGGSAPGPAQLQFPAGTTDPELAAFAPGTTFRPAGETFTVTINAATATGYQVTYSGAGTVTPSSVSVSIANTTSLGSTGQGTVTALGTNLNCTVSEGAPSGACAATLPTSNPLAMVATPATGTTFVQWTGACSGRSSSCSLNMQQSRSVGAIFARLVPVGGISGGSGASGSRFVLAVQVAAGATRLDVSLSGGTGDPDILVVREQLPSDALVGTAGTCFSDNSGTTESCSIQNPASGTWFIGIFGFAAYSGVTVRATVVGGTTTFTQPLTIQGWADGPSNVGGTVTSNSGGLNCTVQNLVGTGSCSAPVTAGSTVSLTASANSSSVFGGWLNDGCAGTGTCTVTVSEPSFVVPIFSRNVPMSAPLTALSGGTNTYAYYAFTAPVGLSRLVVRSSGGTGDADLFVGRGTAPRDWGDTTAVCMSIGDTNDERCIIDNPIPGTYHLLIAGYNTYADMTIAFLTESATPGGTPTASFSPDSLPLLAGGRGSLDLRVDLTALGNSVRLGSYAATVQFDAAVLAVDSVRAVPAGFNTPVVSTPQAGQIRLAAVNVTGAAGVVPLARFFVRSVGATPQRASLFPTFTELVSTTLADLTPALITRPGGIVPGTPPVLRGDVNEDGRVSALDAQAVLASLVGLSIPSAFKPLPNGDANCNGALQALDAQLILSFAVGLPTAPACVGTRQ
jgi:M6 family metalloprotease-like protein